MDFISCPERNQEISSSAILYPNYEYPISERHEQNIADIKLVSPEFPEDLSIGEHIFTVPVIGRANGEATGISMYANGVHVISKGNKLDIHKSQIISLNELTKKEIQAKDSSVIEVTVIGDILTGILSTLGNETETEYFFIVNYWDIDTKNPNTVIVETQKSYKEFINEYYTDVLRAG